MSMLLAGAAILGLGLILVGLIAKGVFISTHWWM